MNNRVARRMVLGLMAISLACGGGDEAEEAETPDGGAAGAPAGGAAAPSAAGGAAASAALITDMRAHLSMIQAAGGDEIGPMIPEHNRQVGALLAQMEQERQARGAMGAAAWDATVDSVRQDLTRMASMPPAELEAAIEPHAARVIRLMDMHASP